MTTPSSKDPMHSKAKLETSASAAQSTSTGGKVALVVPTKESTTSKNETLISKTQNTQKQIPKVPSGGFKFSPSAVPFSPNAVPSTNESTTVPVKSSSIQGVKTSSMDTKEIVTSSVNTGLQGNKKIATKGTSDTEVAATESTNTTTTTTQQPKKNKVPTIAFKKQRHSTPSKEDALCQKS